jgi:RHS repeat-associated protein
VYGQNNVTDVASEFGFPEATNIGYTSYGEGEYGYSVFESDLWGSYKGYETGLMGFKTGVRDYDPQTGRFLQPDPFKGYLSDPASQNPHMYCRGNPIKYSDPSGYEPQPESDRNPDWEVTPGERKVAGELADKAIHSGDPETEERKVYDPLLNKNIEDAPLPETSVTHVFGATLAGKAIVGPVEINASLDPKKTNYLKILFKRLKAGFRIDSPDKHHPNAHPHTWKWK